MIRTFSLILIIIVGLIAPELHHLTHQHHHFQGKTYHHLSHLVDHDKTDWESFEFGDDQSLRQCSFISSMFVRGIYVHVFERFLRPQYQVSFIIKKVNLITIDQNGIYQLAPKNSPPVSIIQYKSLT